jgi:hypothetical protein
MIEIKYNSLAGQITAPGVLKKTARSQWLSLPHPKQSPNNAQHWVRGCLCSHKQPSLQRMPVPRRAPNPFWKRTLLGHRVLAIFSLCRRLSQKGYASTQICDPKYPKFPSKVHPLDGTSHNKVWSIRGQGKPVVFNPPNLRAVDPCLSLL